MTTAAKATVDDPSMAKTINIHTGPTVDAGAETHLSSESENIELVCIIIVNQIFIYLFIYLFFIQAEQIYIYIYK